MARGVDGRTIFNDDLDYFQFLKILKSTAGNSGAKIIAYCLMPNHFHTAIKVGNIPLSQIMQRILTSHAVSFNLRHDRTGHLFQARYKSVLCTNDEYLTVLIRYIHSNPVRANLVGRIDAWRWSSYREYDQIGRNGLVEISEDLPPLDVPAMTDFEPWPKNEGCSKKLIRSDSTNRPNLNDIGNSVSDGIPIALLRSSSRRRQITCIKRRFVQKSVRYGYTLTEISGWLGITVNASKHYLLANNCKPASLTPPL